jgi:hypothetical protein
MRVSLPIRIFDRRHSRVVFTVLLVGVLASLGWMAIESYNSQQGPRIVFYGKVIDPSGTPVAGADVVVRVEQRKIPSGVWQTGSRFTMQTLDVRTGADGRFEIRGMRGVEVSTSFRPSDGYEAVNDPRATPGSFCYDADYIRETGRSCPVFRPDPGRPAVSVVRRSR